MALAAALMDTPVSYEQLEGLEDDFEQAEVDILRYQTKATDELYAKRHKIVSQIPHFWALVFEQAPPDLDEYMQPSDSALLLTSLTSLYVERFELPNGDPRSLAIRFEFSENDHFENKVLEKKFWWRRSPHDDWSGLVSEPVEIKWKEGKDLTSGMLGLVKKVWDEDKGKKPADGEKAADESEAKKALKELMENTGLGGVSFFAWFGFCGRHITAEENEVALKKDAERRQLRKEGKEVPPSDAMDEDEDDEDDHEYEFEIFPTADDVAVCIAEDLWPQAIGYFRTAQEVDDLSDADFESDAEMMGDDDDDEDDDEVAGEGATPPTKKRKA